MVKDVNKKKQDAFVKKILVFVLVLASVALLQIMGKWSLKIDDIDMMETIIPSEFSCDQYEAELNWTYHEVTNERWLEYYVADSNKETRAFQWVDETEGGVIHLAIVDFKVPAIAMMNYFLLDPAGRKKEFYENFQNKTKFVPTNEIWINDFVDQDIVQCGTGTEEKCYGWFYRARYGQYYLYIEDSGPTCYSHFEQVVKAINTEFVKNLQATK